MADLPAECAAIVLAAGGSARLRQPKQLVRINGESLLRRTIRIAAEAGCTSIFVVLGKDGPKLALEAEGFDAEIVLNENWSGGMASSLKSGLSAALRANPQQESVLLLVCDQPQLEVTLLQSIMKAHARERPPITASRYAGTLGVPAIFSRPLFAELFDLTADEGARRILQHHREEAVQIEFPGGAFEVDTPEDLRKLELLVQGPPQSQ